MPKANKVSLEHKPSSASCRSSAHRPRGTPPTRPCADDHVLSSHKALCTIILSLIVSRIHDDAADEAVLLSTCSRSHLLSDHACIRANPKIERPRTRIGKTCRGRCAMGLGGSYMRPINCALDLHTRYICMYIQQRCIASDACGFIHIEIDAGRSLCDTSGRL